jgi:hypothetical protein
MRDCHPDPLDLHEMGFHFNPIHKHVLKNSAPIIPFQDDVFIIVEGVSEPEKIGADGWFAQRLTALSYHPNAVWSLETPSRIS